MQMRPATIFALIFIMLVMILPVFFLDLTDYETNKPPATDDVPSNKPHPHKMPPDMQREVDKSRNQNRANAAPQNTPAGNSPANTPPTNIYD